MIAWGSGRSPACSEGNGFDEELSGNFRVSVGENKNRAWEPAR